MANGLPLLRATLAALRDDGLTAAVFGGWAEELHGLRPAGSPHGDIDLLLLAPDPDLLDRALLTRPEVTAKRFPHKRAYLAEDGTLVELFLAHGTPGTYRTRFWDRTDWRWPPDTPVPAHGLPTVGPEGLTAYRAAWHGLHADAPGPGG